MKVPLSWLRAYVDVPLLPNELGRRLTMAGLEASGITQVGGSWDNVFVASVVSVAPHPNADRLTLATVDLGGEQITAVCGAPNVAAGQRVAFAKAGARLFDSHSGHLETLKAARIRGVVSNGMVCSELELGLGQDHTGILVLDQDAPVGAPLADYLGDAVLDLEVTPNRPDWLSILGVAHEVAALNGGSVREPDITYPEAGPAIGALAKVMVEAQDLCPRYTASLLTDLRVGPSPKWMQDRLLRAGQRPINNLVDITNYVMLEYGQPLHAFDYDTLEEKTVRVRRARPGEALVTLDGQSHPLGPDMLVIADAKHAVGLAGVMGGAKSEVTEATTSVLLESAKFNPVSIRRTSAALKMRTEASVRFERNLNPELAPVALRRATQLMHQLAGGKVAQGILDVYPGRQDRQAMPLTLARVEKVLGVRFSLEECRAILTSLGFGCRRRDQGALLVDIPYWRSDITLEDDLVEDLARVRGYDAVPTTFLSTAIPQHQPQPERELREKVKDLLAAAGLQETISYPLTSHDMLDRTQALDTGSEPLKVANPMSPEQEYLRTSLRGSILATLEMNQRYGQPRIGLFEVGRVYLPRPGDLPEEREMAVGVAWGDRSPVSWADDGGNTDFFDAKGVVQAVLEGLGLTGEFTPAEDPLLHPGRTASVNVAGQRVGVVGEVRPEAQEQFGISGGAVAMFELDLAGLLPLLPTESRRFAPWPRFPGSSRDLALVVDLEVTAARLEAIVRGNDLVENVTVFDVYAGKGIPQGKKSIGLRILYQSPRQTLTAEAVNAAQEHILRQLTQETGAELRA